MTLMHIIAFFLEKEIESDSCERGGCGLDLIALFPGDGGDLRVPLTTSVTFALERLLYFSSFPFCDGFTFTAALRNLFRGGPVVNSHLAATLQRGVGCRRGSSTCWAEEQIDRVA